MNKNILTILLVVLVAISFANCDRKEFNKIEPTQPSHSAHAPESTIQGRQGVESFSEYNLV